LGSKSGKQSSPTNLINKVTDFIPLSADPPNATAIIAKADSGVSNHYFKEQDAKAITNLRPTPWGPSVVLPDSTTIQATYSSQLLLHPNLSKNATTAHVLGSIPNSSLVSLGQLCGDNCVAVLDKAKLQVFKNTVCILQGKHNIQDGVWDIHIPLPTESPNLESPRSQHQLKAIIHKDLAKTQLVQYLHGCCCGSPVTSTWKHAIQNRKFITWPGIETLSVDAHLPKSVATAQGHLDQEQKSLQSTQVQRTKETIDDNFFPSPDTPNVKTFAACAQIVPFLVKNTAYHDLTGWFPHCSSRGNK
jgi:hypothetical protein